MGVIVKLLYRDEGLKKPTHRNLFVDMEENIHIHYRDLRIELSRKEFEDIVHTFTLQSAELMEIIKEKDFQDGVLPNTNSESVTIWTESKQENDVVYHPQRISLEECTDGFHIHLRNYKFLLDAEDFAVLVEAFKSIDLDAPFASTWPEILELLEANHLHFAVRKEGGDSAKGKGVHHIIVARYHEPKVRGILTGIGMERTVDKKVHRYSKEKLVLEVVMSDNKALFADKIASVERSMLPLVEYLSRERSVDPDRLNALKAQVLDTFSYVEKSGTSSNINLDYRSWIYNVIDNDVVFPFNPARKEVDTKTLYRDWSNFLKEMDLYFVKPTKKLADKKRQKALYKEIIDRIIQEVSPVMAVSKVYILGSAIRGEMGLYTSPFIHSRWAKLGSDVDLLFEIDERAPVEFPDQWNYINISSGNQCDIYHIGEVDSDDDFGQRQRYPNIDYFQHLLDAYVYFPSKGDEEKKNAFLKRFKAQVIFDRGSNGGGNVVQEALEREFGESVKNLRRLDVPTENELYEVEVNGERAILKVYKVSGNYSSSRLAEHTEYECEVINAIGDRGVPTAPIIRTGDGKNMIEINDDAAVLFKKLEGIEGGEPNYPVEESAKELALFHQAQMKKPLKIDTEFSFDQVFDLWRVEFHRFRDESTHDEELSQAFAKLEETYKDIEKIYADLTAKKEIVWLHNHGDMTPRNVILNDGKAYLFDFQNAFYGPRLFDLVEGGIEFSWGSKNAKFNDFQRFDQFVKCYTDETKLSATEKKGLESAIKVLGLIKFVKEVRMIKGAENKNNLRRLRALDLAAFMEKRSQPKKRRRRRR